MKYLKKYEKNKLIPEEYSDFIKWVIINSSTSEKRKFAYNIITDTWLDLKDYKTYYTIDDLYVIYNSKKYNL